MLALLATGMAACSTTGDGLALNEGYGGSGYPGSNLPGTEDDMDAPAGGETGGGPGDDDGVGEDPLPPAPDDEGVDNASDPGACDPDSEVTLYLSPDDSNSISSPVQVREAVLGDWGSVQSIAIRTWEFFNYYSFGYPAAPEAGDVAITPSLLHTEGTAGDYLLQIGISSHELTAATRAPINVTLVLDTSGSMAGLAMDMLRETCLAIASSLREGDTVSMVTWSTEDAVVLGGHSIAGPDDPTLRSELEALEAGGGTDLNGGLVAGYELAQQVYDPERINRIVLVSDGGANVGITDIDLIAQHAGNADEDGIYMVGVGVGDPVAYHDNLMDTVTDVGKGASVFIASEEDAWSVFGDDFISTIDVAARDVQIRLDLPPGFEIVRTSTEELSTDKGDVEPQHLAPNDAMVFHQQIRTCAPDLVTDEDTLAVTVSYYDARTFEARELRHEVSFGELLAADPAQLLKGAAIFTYAESLKAYKNSDHDGRDAIMTDAFDALQRAEQALPEDPDLAEIRVVLEALLQ
ncbi:MAG: VWA domain-containing protein [Myxococcota bacterium]